jgi:hypothetical protein
MSKTAGYLVETKTGLKGRTFHSEKLLNSKMIVHLIDENDNLQTINGVETKMLCDPKSIKIIGYID